MDANGTRLHLLLGRDDWARCSVDGVRLGEIWDSSPPQPGSGKLIWNDERCELTLEPRLFKFITPPEDSLPSIENRRGAARDVYGNWYWIDETARRIRARSVGSGLSSDFWPAADASACAGGTCGGAFEPRDQLQSATAALLGGLAVTEDHYLVVGVIDPAGLLVFDLHAGGEPRRVLWPTSVPFTPFDMAARPGGGIWILDREHHCYWGLDRNFNVIGPRNQDTEIAAAKLDDFQPLVGSATHGRGERSFPGSFSLAQSPTSIIDPIAIEALPDGSVLILDRDPAQRFSRIYRFRFAEQLPDRISTGSILGMIEQEQQGDFSLIAYDIAFVPQHAEADQTVQDRLYVVAADGNQSFAFRLCLRDQKIELQPIAEYLPMRLFGGKALVGTGDGAFYDFADGWIPLVQQRRPRYVSDATLDTPPLDSREPDCVWHRLMLDACIAPETRVEIFSRTANELNELSSAQWQPEPLLYLRGDGSELPFLRSALLLNGAAAPKPRDGDGTWELLFQRARGRFLQLRMRLSGNERSTPRLRVLRAYYPRFSYLVNYLPGVYREDEQSASFLERFLANLEGLYTTLEDKIAAVQVLFDVRSAPAEVLEWLATWFGVALDPTWDEERRRLFIKHALDFFQYRGTRRGLAIALHLALDDCGDETIFDDRPVTASAQQIRIVEKYLTRTTPGIVFGDTSAPVGTSSVTTSPSWRPDQGVANLNQRFAGFLDPRDTVNRAGVHYPLIAPADPAQAAQWARFSQTTLGFVPSTAPAERIAWQNFLQTRYPGIESLNAAYQTSYSAFTEIVLPRDLPKGASPLKDWQDFVLDPKTAGSGARHLWQNFLARRYRRLKAFNQAYATAWTSFEVVSLPDQLPSDGAPLLDWFQFEGVVIQMQSAAHRFTVLLPVPLSLAFSAEEHARRLALSRRIIDLEKPAHTVFDVKFYWAMFRLGEARLQLDTVLDQGSRAPQLLPGMILDRGFIGESYLAPPVPEDASDRYIIGRDPLAITPDREKRS